MQNTFIYICTRWNPTPLMTLYVCLCVSVTKVEKVELDKFFIWYVSRGGHGWCNDDGPYCCICLDASQENAWQKRSIKMLNDMLDENTIWEI